MKWKIGAVLVMCIVAVYLAGCVGQPASTSPKITSVSHTVSNEMVYTSNCNYVGTTIKCEGEVQAIKSGVGYGVVMIVNDQNNYCKLGGVIQEFGELTTGDRRTYSLSCSLPTNYANDVYVDMSASTCTETSCPYLFTPLCTSGIKCM